MSNIFFTADPHYAHTNVITYCKRPWADVVEMQADLIERWNSVVQRDDVVYVLGDFSLHPRELIVLSGLKGHKRLISGNHDKVWSGHKDAHKHFKFYLDSGFETIDSFRKIKLAGQHLMLSHFPYSQNGAGERYRMYRMRDNGVPLLHGHVHQQWKTNLSLHGTPMINVGVDVWDYTPVALEEVTSLLADFPEKVYPETH